MYFLEKVIHGNLSAQKIFSLREHPDYLFTFQELPPWLFWPELKTKGFHLKCYESKPLGRQIGYIYCTFKDDILIIDTKKFPLPGRFLANQINKLEIEYQRKTLPSNYALMIYNEFSQKGFGKLLIKMAFEIGLYQYQLKNLFLSSVNKPDNRSYFFYCHILNMTPKSSIDRYPRIEMSLKEAWKAISGVGAGDRVRTDGN